MTRNSERADARLLTNELLEFAEADTQCADLYLHRARELVSAELTPAQYAALDELNDEIAELTNRIEAAITERGWSLGPHPKGERPEPPLRSVRRRPAEKVRDLAARRGRAPVHPSSNLTVKSSRARAGSSRRRPR